MDSYINNISYPPQSIGDDDSLEMMRWLGVSGDLDDFIYYYEEEIDHSER